MEPPRADRILSVQTPGGGLPPKAFFFGSFFFALEKERTPREGSKKTWRSASDGSSLYQVGPLRLIVDMHDNVIKEIVYNPFGGIIEDTNAGFRIPLGFAGGLHDRDLGFVRFGWRDKSAGQRIWTLRSFRNAPKG